MSTTELRVADGAGSSATLTGFPVDLHAHVLPGIDDGPDTVDDALALCVSLCTEGVHTVVATPHVTDRFPTTATARDAALNLLQSALHEHSIALNVLAGGELSATWAAEATDAALADFSPAEHLILIESPFRDWDTDFMVATCADLVHRGWQPVLAHPERTHDLRVAPERLDAVLATGAQCHATTEAFTGRFGEECRSFVLELAQSDRLAAVATDCHHATRRPPSVAAAVHACKSNGVSDSRIVELFKHGPARLLGLET